MTVGDLKAGLQTGFCKDTGGGWSRMMQAHRSQLWAVPPEMDERTAVLVEPLACAIHAALRARVPDGASVLVVGAGTVGLLTLIALRRFTPAGYIVVAAKHPRQRAAAVTAGADEVVRPEHAVKAVRRNEHAVKLTPERGMEFLLGGVDVALECVGSKAALDLALRTTKAGGRVVLSGIPGGGADLTPLWFRELELVGAYTGGMEDVEGGPRHSVRPCPGACVEPSHARSSSSARPIRWIGGARPWTTRWPRDGSARSRWRSRHRNDRRREDAYIRFCGAPVGVRDA